MSEQVKIFYGYDFGKSDYERLENSINNFIKNKDIISVEIIPTKMKHYLGNGYTETVNNIGALVRYKIKESEG